MSENSVGRLLHPADTWGLPVPMVPSRLMGVWSTACLSPSAAEVTTAHLSLFWRNMPGTTPSGHFFAAALTALGCGE